MRVLRYNSFMKRLFFLSLISFLFFGCDDNKIPSYAPQAKTKEFRVYKVGIHPYLNSAKMYEAHRPILDYVENHLGDVQLVLETSLDYADYETKLYRGDFDFSLPNPYQTIHAIEKGYDVIARMKPDDVFRGIIVARKDANIKTVADLKGKAVSFPAPTALAATMMPLYFLHKNGLDTQRDIKKKFVGSQFSSILNAYSKDTVAGATWPPPWELWKKENPQKASEMEVVWQTQPLINNSIVAKRGVDPEIVAQMRRILLELDTTPQGQKLLENAGFAGFAHAKNGDYDVVIEFLRDYNEELKR